MQAAFSASSKNFKKAVERNRIKRVVREAWRLQKPSLNLALQENQQCMAVFIIYTGNALPQYKTVYDKMGKALEKLEKLVAKI